MPLPYSGPISFSNIASYFGDTGSVSLSSYVRGGSYITQVGNANLDIPLDTTTGIKISNLYGATKAYTVTISANTKQAYIGSAVTGGANVTPSGYAPGDSLYIQINSNVYVWSDNTAVAGLTITTSSNGQTGILVDTSTTTYPAYIMGRGGSGGTGSSAGFSNALAGGPAINIVSSAGRAGSRTAVVFNGNYGYIAGGGGGGAQFLSYDSSSPIYGGGGGGAGGGTGGNTYNSRHGDFYSGGTGGAIGVIGSSGAGAGTTIAVGGTAGGRSGYTSTDGLGKTHDGSSAGSGGGRVLPGVGAGAGTVGGGGSSSLPGSNGSVGSRSTPGGGGGGWGARGGYGYSQNDNYQSQAYAPGLGGPAIIYTVAYSSISFSGTQLDRTYGSLTTV